MEDIEDEAVLIHVEVEGGHEIVHVRLGVGPCRNLPFGGRATRGSRVRLPREEGAQSRHQRLFEENVKKTKCVVYKL